MTALKLCILLGVHLLGFLVPGAVVVGLWRTTQVQNESRSSSIDLLYVLVCSGLISYGSFFVYVLSPLVGRMYSLGVFVGCLLLLTVRSASRRYVRALLTHRDVLTPLLIALSVGVLYTGSTLLYGGEVHVSLVANSRYRDPLPPDNILPRLVAERVIDGIRGEPFLGDWLSSDRPPLQAGVEALVSPLIPKGSRELHYQALATMLQLLVIPAGWMLLRRLEINFVSTLGVVTATALSGTVALNSSYVWPKLLCGAYSLLGITAALPNALRRSKVVSLVPRGLIGGAAFGLSFAAHGGALFVVVPMLCVLTMTLVRALWRRKVLGKDGGETPPQNRMTTASKPGEILVATGGALIVGALLFAPWMVYQQRIAPPGNRLLKWHLAGVIEVDQRSFGQAMLDRYTKVPTRELVANKTSNLRELVNPARFLADVMPVLGSDDSIDRVRQREFGHLGNAVSVSVVGIGLGLAGWLVNRRRTRELTVGLLGLSAGSFATLLWCVVLYGPKATIPHQGSLAVPLVLIGSSALLAAAVHRWVLGVFVALCAYKVTRVWILAGPLSPERQRSAAALVLLLGGAVALVGVVGRALRCATTQDVAGSSAMPSVENVSALV